MARPPIEGGTVLITSASSGIGREIARALAPRAGAMVLVARRRERLEQLAQELQAGHARAVVHVRPGTSPMRRRVTGCWMRSSLTSAISTYW